MKQKLSQIHCISPYSSAWHWTKAFYGAHILFHSPVRLWNLQQYFKARKVVADIWHLSYVFIKNVCTHLRHSKQENQKKTRKSKKSRWTRMEKNGIGHCLPSLSKINIHFLFQTMYFLCLVNHRNLAEFLKIGFKHQGACRPNLCCVFWGPVLKTWKCLRRKFCSRSVATKYHPLVPI